MFLSFITLNPVLNLICKVQQSSATNVVLSIPFETPFSGEPFVHTHKRFVELAHV